MGILGSPPILDVDGLLRYLARARGHPGFCSARLFLNGLPTSERLHLPVCRPCVFGCGATDTSAHSWVCVEVRSRLGSLFACSGQSFAQNSFWCLRLGGAVCRWSSLRCRWLVVASRSSRSSSPCEHEPSPQSRDN